MQEKLKNPLFYGENRTAAHSDHKYYVSEAEFAQNIQSLKKTLDGVKILGNGELTKKLTVQVNAFSAGAKEKIEALGGKAEVI